MDFGLTLYKKESEVGSLPKSTGFSDWFIIETRRFVSHLLRLNSRVVTGIYEVNPYGGREEVLWSIPNVDVPGLNVPMACSDTKHTSINGWNASHHGDKRKEDISDDLVKLRLGSNGQSDKGSQRSRRPESCSADDIRWNILNLKCSFLGF